MRPLIRPFLFAVARLGLFLAVVAWIVGQRWDLSLSALYAEIDGNETGLVTKAWFPERYGESDLSVWFWRRNADVVSSTCLDWDGQSRFRYRDGFLYIALPHWLIVSTVIAFNVLLHIIYRKRPESEPCED